MLAHDPVGQTAAPLRNTALQALWIDSGWLSYAPAFTEQLARGAWPRDAETILQGAVAAAALALLIREALRRGPRGDAEHSASPLAGLVLAALLVNAFLGGALSEPQNRYQGRSI